MRLRRSKGVRLIMSECEVCAGTLDEKIGQGV